MDYSCTEEDGFLSLGTIDSWFSFSSCPIVLLVNISLHFFLFSGGSPLHISKDVQKQRYFIIWTSAKILSSSDVKEDDSILCPAISGQTHETVYSYTGENSADLPFGLHLFSHYFSLLIFGAMGVKHASNMISYALYPYLTDLCATHSCNKNVQKVSSSGKQK